MADQYKDTPRVAEVLNKFRLVINRGSEDGIEVGTRFLVFGLGQTIVDPDTKEDLGLLEVVRGRARVVHVQERISTLESSETVTTPGKKRTVRRTSNRFLGNPTEEEIEEGRETRLAPIGAEVGDLVRPV